MKGTNGSKIVEGLITEGIHILWRTLKPSFSSVRKGKLLFDVENGTYSGFTDKVGKPAEMYSLLKKLGFKAGDRL